MMYLLCALYFTGMSLYQFHAHLQVRGDGAGERAQLFSMAGILITAQALVAPVLLELFQVTATTYGTGVRPGIELLPLWFMAAGSMVALVTFSMRLHRQRLAGNPPFLALGANVMGFLAGAYIAFVVIDQLTFFTPSRNDAGVLNWTIMRGDSSLREIECEAEMLMVSGIDSGTATYRCPNVPQIVYGRFSGTPIVPWPGYREGQSTALARAVRELQRGTQSPVVR